MNEEYPDQGQAGGNHDQTAERVSSAVPPQAGSTLPAGAPAGPVAAQLPPTGDDRVDAAVAGLRRLPGLPAAEHVAVLEEVHGRLRDILGELSEDGS
jgi:hypothetical protein